MRRHHWFLFVSQGVLILFLGVMVYVLAVAYTRRSGSAGLDMAAIQKIRYDQQQQASALIP
jgi:hypothetical protein